MAFKPPRTVFLDFPLGCPAGKPNEPELQRMILRAVLEAAPLFRRALEDRATSFSMVRGR